MTDNGFTWSYSRLKNFETCPKRSYHYDIKKDIVEPTTLQLQEGNDLHASFEARILRRTPLPLGLMHHEPMLARVVDAPGRTYGEKKLAITSNFTPVGFFGKGVWLRIVIDATKVNGTTAAVFDWKTGKVIRDMTQMQIFAAVMFHHMPELQRIKAALVFVNHDVMEIAEFVREDITEIWSEILPRVNKLKEARQTQEYLPKPSGLCKRYCAVTSCIYHGRGG